MKIKQLLLNASTICVVAVAALLFQSVFNESVKAENPESDGGGLKQRILDLEDRQAENDVEFVLIDTSLADLDARVNDNEARGRVNSTEIRSLKKRIDAITKRCGVLKADHRALTETVARMRARNGGK